MPLLRKCARLHSPPKGTALQFSAGQSSARRKPTGKVGFCGLLSHYKQFPTVRMGRSPSIESQNGSRHLIGSCGSVGPAAGNYETLSRFFVRCCPSICDLHHFDRFNQSLKLTLANESYGAPPCLCSELSPASRLRPHRGRAYRSAGPFSLALLTAHPLTLVRWGHSQRRWISRIHLCALMMRELSSSNNTI